MQGGGLTQKIKESDLLINPSLIQGMIAWYGGRVRVEELFENGTASIINIDTLVEEIVPQCKILTFLKTR